jgi:putative addiction module killer protein
VEVTPREIRFYENGTGQVPCRDWLDSLHESDPVLYGVVMNRIERVEEGNFGNCDPVGEGVHELKVDVGPGYRVYFGEDGGLVILLLGDMKGTRKRQQKNIKTAKEYWGDYNA